MKLEPKKIVYRKLNARQKENYNFHKLSAVLANYGYTSIRLSDDWEGADFIALHIDGKQFLKVQLKGRPYYCKKYIGKELCIAFRDKEQWYLYPHDELLQKHGAVSKFKQSKSWKRRGEYHLPSISARLRRMLKRYALDKSDR
ncbi:MAG: hypothetical protein NT006_12320 [Candidatus Aminicenantes bacterium]|nr:hypothetical protein [Candidatus Aminicenantes bacterium]